MSTVRKTITLTEQQDRWVKAQIHAGHRELHCFRRSRQPQRLVTEVASEGAIRSAAAETHRHQSSTSFSCRTPRTVTASEPMRQRAT